MDTVILGLLLLIFMVIGFDVYKYDNLLIEQYDATIENTTLDKCSLACKLSRDCKGFGYNAYTNICYPSKTEINGKILGQLYSNKYKKSNIKCNKFSELAMNKKAPNANNRRDNSLFICTKTDFDDEDMYYHYDNKLVKVLKPSSFDKINKVDYYEMNNFKWPSNKFEQNIVEQAINKNIKIYSHENTESNKKKESLLKKKQVSNFIKDKKHYEKQTYKKKAIQVPSHIYEISPKIISNKNLYKYGCVGDIKLKTCLTECSKDSTCKGAEWNPLYLKLIKNNAYKQYKNVCCLKNSSELDNRDNSFTAGNSYIKKSQIDTNKKYYVF